MAYEDNFDYTSNVKAAIRGDEEAFTRLYLQSYDLVYATCRSSVSDRSMTDDMVQETYIQVYHKLYQIKDPSKFNGWVCTVARNICYRENESNKTKERERRTTPIGGVHDDNMADERILYQMNRDEFNELANDDFVGQLLSDLNEEERRCILLYSEGYKEKEIAEMLEIPLGTVKSRKHYALGKMRKQAEEIEEKEGYKLHGFTAPAFFSALRILRRVQEALGFSAAAPASTFQAEQKANPADSVGKASVAAGAKASSHVMLWRILAVVLSLGVVAAAVSLAITHRTQNAGSLISSRSVVTSVSRSAAAGGGQAANRNRSQANSTTAARANRAQQAAQNRGQQNAANNNRSAPQTQAANLATTADDRVFNMDVNN